MTYPTPSTMDLVYEVKSLTTYTCYECCSCHTMTYGSTDEYTCEECYRVLPFHEVNGEINVDWKGMKRLLLHHDDPREVIRIFILHIQREEVDEDNIDEILYQFHQTTLFLGH